MCDWLDLIEALTYHLRGNRATLYLGETVASIDTFHDERGDHVRVQLASGKQVITDKVLYSVGRRGATDSLCLTAAGLCADERGRLKVNEYYQTDLPHIYAVGDVIGFPSLASTSMEQGRLASCHAFGLSTNSMPELFPYGIFTVPSISMVGKTEEQLTKKGVPYEVGRAQYREMARGQILGDRTGLLKLIFHRKDRRLLGVHIIGAEAAELAECYKTAAFDGINRLGLA